LIKLFVARASEFDVVLGSSMSSDIKRYVGIAFAIKRGNAILLEEE